MKTYLALFVAATLFSSCATPPSATRPPTPSKLVERISVPFREHGYSQMSYQIIRSEVGLRRFLSEIGRQPHWNNKAAFLHALRAGRMDFAQSNLLLFSLSEPSGSIRIHPQITHATTQEVYITIHRTVPKIGTADMAYYALAYKLSKTVRTVIFDDGRKKIRIRNKI